MIVKRFFVLLFTALLVLAPILEVNASSQESIYKTQFPCLHINAIDIENFNKVDGYYYRGAQPNDYDIKSLALLGVKTIINLRKVHSFSQDEFQEQKKIAESFRLKYINIPMSPASPPNNQQISYFLKIISNPDNLPVYVHCAQGKDRTGIMTAIYRINRYGWRFDQAYSEMKRMGYHSVIFPKQKRFLQDYVSDLFN